MKNIYSTFRIMLITFSLGLAGFWFYDGISNGLIDKPVNLPVSKSEEIFVVFPRFKKEMPDVHLGGYGCGSRKTITKN